MRILPAAAAGLAATALLALGAAGASAAPRFEPPPTLATTTAAAPAAVPFDQAFIDAMVPHHQMALAMAKAAQARGLKNATTKRIAAAILATQAKEIAQMKAWRAAWYPGAKALSGDAAGKVLGLGMAGMGMAHDASALATSKDVDADFAALMVPHHQGAVAMAKLALRKAAHPELKALARAIIAAQTREIAQLKPLAAGSMAGMDMG